ncbi:flagellar protein FlgN [Crassaminicella thermophila]|uniref:Flagellar protein FlgN n=1 Tax=Crassaminicella thermophila TaxID=2599308 RepID=A0A5C0SB64_CRATE|nr:flagellar export chaperone FlgN [Crassaminicella thermophila]QEK11330.1 flagellar protein FlgN [Crassaminicella thermophila]
MNIKDTIDLLIDISKKKETALKKILNLTIMQEGLIKNNDLEKLGDLLKKKQYLIEKINQMDIDFLSNYGRLKKSLGITSIENVNVEEYPSLKELKLHIQNIMKSLRQIDEIDKRNTKNLQIDFDKVKEELKKIKAKKQSSKIAASYMKKYASVQGVFIDKK